MSNQSNALSVKLAIKTADVRQNLAKIINDFEGFSLQEQKDVARIDVLVLEIGSDPDAEFETIRSLLKENVVGNLFLTSSKTTSEILLPALRAGAREFFPQPIDPDEVKDAFHKVLSTSRQNAQTGDEPLSQGKIFSVIGSKGGVGTTTFAVNLATSIQALDKNKLVALVDMNILLGEVPLFLDLETDTNWEEIGRNLNRLDGAYLQSAMAQHSSGLYVMPAPSKLETEKHLPSGFLFLLLKAMRQFFDYIIVDSGMYLDDSLFKIFAESEAVYLISIMSLPCVINVKKLKDSILSSSNIDKENIKIIANRFEKKAQISLNEAKKIIGKDIALTIPNNYSLVMTAINSGQEIAKISEKSNVSKVYKKLAQAIAEPAIEKPGGRFTWFK
jgi:pilus assembly protein CpaE